MRLFGMRVPAAASLILWAVAWEVAGRLELVPILPPLTEALGALVDLVRTRQFLAGAETTLVAFGVGMALAVALGVPLGVLMGRYEPADRLLGMWVNLLASAPLSALVPVLMLLCGLGVTTVIVTVVLFAAWIIVLDSRAGVRHVSPSLLEMARAFGAGPAAVYLKIMLWAALPEILAGIRIGLVRGVKGVVIGQLLVSVIGFGEMLELFSRNFLMREFWALTLVLFAFALGVSGLVGLLERRLEYYAATRS